MGKPHDAPRSKSSPSEKSIETPGSQLRPDGVQLLPTKLPVDRPNLEVTVGAETPPFSMRLITPPTAADPYCAAAPSRRTSMRSMAATGMALRSTPVDPRPMLLLRWTSPL